MAIQLKPISKEYLISSLKGFEKYILNKKYQEKGIQPDWDESDADSASFIKNKPSSLPASDVPDWAKEHNKPSYSKEEIGLGNVDNTSDEDKPVSTAQQEELDKKIDKTTVATDSTLGLIKSGEDIAVDNNGNVSVKDNSHNHKVENISDLTASASEINILDGITASTDELNHITGVTDNIQTQLDGKAPATHTHDDRYYTESEIDDKLTEKFADLKTVAFSGSYDDLLNKPTVLQNKDGLGLENVDNTADIDKPVSTAQQNAIDLAVSEHNTSESSHTDIRSLISDLTARLNALADSDDTTLDQLSEIVAYIKNNKDLIDGVTTNKVSVSDIIDELTSTAANKPLSANQGKILNDLITALTTAVGDKVDKVSGKGLSTNDYTTSEKNKLDGIASGANVNVQADWNVTDNNSDAYIKNKPESLPASDVHDWAKAETKPEYSKSEVGLGNVPNVATNDQTPTFSRASTRANIVSGEKLGVMLGKISKYFNDLKTVAFTGSYNDLSNKPNIPDYRNYKQETVVSNPSSTRKYVRFAYISPHTSAHGTSATIGLTLRQCDYKLYSMASVTCGFGYWDPSMASDGWVDGLGFAQVSATNIDRLAANSDMDANRLVGKLVMVMDSIDTFCSELWIKLEPTDVIHISLDFYAESYTIGNYPNYTGRGWGNANDCGYQVVNFVCGDNQIYLDHPPTSTDSAYSGSYEDYPHVIAGNWS